MQLRRGSRYWLALTALTFAGSALRAQGFGLNEISTCGLGRGYAAVASGCHDASAIYWNPAAAATLDGWNWVVGASSIAVDGKFVQDTTFRTYKGDVPTAIVPHAFLNYHAAGSKASFGLGVYVPYGLTSQWHTDFPGRFSAQKASLQTLYVQPNVGWRITPNWSIGVGPVVGHSSVELRQSLDLSTVQVTGQPFTFASLGVAKHTEFGTARLKGDAWGYGAHFGLQGKLSSNWMFGVRYLTPITFKYDAADATFAQVNTGLILPAGNPLGLPTGTPLDAVLGGQFTGGGALTAQKVSTKITHPQQLQVGFAYTGYRNWELEADYAMIGYKAFKELPIDFSNPATTDRTLIEDYNNSSAIRLGAEYSFANRAKARAGFAGVTRAAPDVTVTPLLPEQDRANYSLGVTIPVFGNFMIDGGYVLVTTPGRRGRIDERTSTSQTAAQLNSGVYSLTANIFALSLKASF